MFLFMAYQIVWMHSFSNKNGEEKTVVLHAEERQSTNK